MQLAPEHALIFGLREGRSETELTRALAAVFAADEQMAADFVRLVLSLAPHAGKIQLDIDRLPKALLTRTEEARVTKTEERDGNSRLDLSFFDEARLWHVIVELKIHAGYGANQVDRYLDAFYPEAKHKVLAAVTRNVPAGSDAAKPRWAGAVRWGDLLCGLRRLRISNELLAQQWPLFLDVLKAEGSMGFTSADTDLIRAWARYPQARDHISDFVDAVRRPLLDELRLSIARGRDAEEPDENDAAFYKRGKTAVRTVIPQLGKVTVRFRVPASGTERVFAGFWGWGEPRFVVETPYPAADSDSTREAVMYLLAHGFESWRDRVLSSYLPLDGEALARPTLQQDVVTFARGAFDAIVASGVLAVAAVTADEAEPDG